MGAPHGPPSTETEGDVPLAPCTAYGLWARSDYGKFGATWMRAGRAWKAVEAFLDAQEGNDVARSMRESLCAGATEEHIDTVEAQIMTLLGLDASTKLPVAYRAILRHHDGQGLLFDRERGRTEASIRTAFHGLFGGYIVYDHCVNVRLYSIKRALDTTTWLRNQGSPVSLHDTHIVIAASFNFSKCFTMDVCTGNIYCATVMGNDPDDSVPACPVSEKDGEHDAVLRWFEHYARLVDADVYDFEELQAGEDVTKGLSLFPVRESPFGTDLPAWSAPWRRVDAAVPPTPRPVAPTDGSIPLLGPSIAITQGVRVACAAVMLAEHGIRRNGDRVVCGFAYSVRYDMPSMHELRTLGCAPGSAADAQLDSRHWLFTDGAGKVNEVRGKAVIGLHPHLQQAADGAARNPFVYQSQTGPTVVTTHMRGGFDFVPGTLQRPMGPTFYARCNELVLDVPRYVR